MLSANTARVFGRIAAANAWAEVASTKLGVMPNTKTALSASTDESGRPSRRPATARRHEKVRLNDLSSDYLDAQKYRDFTAAWKAAMQPVAGR